jgi:saccharopine dehydrogenase-like NADP-dependent oxidoreductase
LLATEECHLRLADRNAEALRVLTAELADDRDRISLVMMDMADAPGLGMTLDGCAVVANFVGPFYRWGAVAAQGAIDAGAHYVDICDDDKATKQILALSEPASAADVTLLTGLGSGPGVTNILAALCAAQLDEIDVVEFGWFASGDPTSAGPAAFAHLLWGFCTPFEALVDGEVAVIEPFDESFSTLANFGAPFGEMRLWAFPHPEPLTFRHFMPGLRTAINRGCSYPVEVMDVLRAWHRLGYADPQAQAVADTELAASEFAVRHFVEHGTKLLGPARSPHASGMSIQVRGERDGTPAEFTIRAATERTMAAETGVPAGVGVAMLLAGEVETRGTIAPECLDPSAFFERFRRRPRTEADSGGGLRIEHRNGDGIEPVRLGQLLTDYRPLVTR